MSQPKYYIEPPQEIHGAIETGINAIIGSIEEFIQDSSQSSVIKIAAKSSVPGQFLSAGISLAYEATGETNTLTIGSVAVELQSGVIDAAATVLITDAIITAGIAALGIAGVAINFPIIAVTVAVGTAVTVAYNYFLDDTVHDFVDSLAGTLDTDLQLRDASGNVLGGAFYKDGLGSATEADVVRDLLLNTPSSALNLQMHEGMQVSVIKGQVGTETNLYTIVDATFVDKILQHSGDDLPSFLSRVDNGEHHVVVGGQSLMFLGQSDLVAINVGGAAHYQKNVGFAADAIEIAGEVFLGTTLAVAKDNYLVGDATVNTLNGAGGNDYIYGEAGKDTLLGGAGNDYLYAGHTFSDNDELRGEAGDDVLFGSLGDNILAGGTGHDVVFGRDGNDTLSGSYGNNILAGGSGVDVVSYDFAIAPVRIELTDAAPVFSSQFHPDVADLSLAPSLNFQQAISVDSFSLDVGDYLNSVEHINATNGADLVVVSDLTSTSLGDLQWIDLGDEAQGGEFVDLDTVDASNLTGAVRLELSSDQSQSIALVSDPAVSFAVKNAEVFLTGSGNDIVDGAGFSSGKPIQVHTGAGADLVRSLDSGMEVYGGLGNDTLIGGAGADFLHGGVLSSGAPVGLSDGLDTVDYSSVSAPIELRFSGSSGGSSLIVTNDGHGSSDELVSIEKVIGTAGKDIFKIIGVIPDGAVLELDAGGGQGSTPRDTVDLSGASKEIDVLIAENGTGSIKAKDLSGGSIHLKNFNSEIIGSSFDDVITDRNNSTKIIDGGAGNDIITVDGLASTVSGGIGHDTLLGGAADDLLSGSEGNDGLIGGLGNDVLHGGADDDQLSGGVGHDQLDGGDGNDTLQGDAGNDTLVGGIGDDLLFGGENDDTLVGGDGVDQLNGGLGADQFHVGAGDVVQDAELLDNIYFEGRLLAGATQDVKIVDGVKEYPVSGLLGAHGERYVISADVQEQGGAGITLTIHLPGDAGTVVLNDFHQGDGGIELYDRIETSGEESGRKFGQAGGLVSPLVLDLDGDGIELTGLQSSQTYFDLDADGFAEKTGWVGGGDGLLALDRNNDGMINDITEVFGNATTDGFTELALLDSNTDGVIDAADADFADLRVWIDSDRDGTSDAGELKTFGELEIASISLMATEVTQTQLGNEITHVSSYSKTDGSQQTIVDAWFANDQIDTRYLGDTTVSAEVAALANLKGFGEASDLQVASENDAVLKGLVAEFDTLQIADIASIADKAEAILYRWTGSQDVAPDSRGAFVDARQLTAMEKLFGEDFFQTAGIGGSNPGPNAGHALTALWREMVTDTAAKLFLQSAQSGLFASAGYDLDSDRITNSLEGQTGAIDFQALALAAPAPLAEKLAYWQGLIPMIQIIASASGLQALDYSQALTDTLAAGGVPLTLEEAMITRALPGTTGADSLTGTSGRDLLDGGQGNDHLAGADGGDVYVFARGGGQDVIVEQDGEVGGHSSDRLEFLDVASSEVTLQRNGDDLIVKVDGSSDQVTVTDQFFENNLGPDTIFRIDTQIEAIAFSDGEVWDEQRIREELLTATDGDDTLTGFFAADRLDGGLGNDLLLGGDDADTYVFGLGYGQDEIYDEMTSIFFKDPDIVAFGSGIAQGDLIFSRGGVEGDDLIIDVAGTTDRLTIRDQFFAGNLGQDGTFAIDNRIEEFHFADGSQLSDQQVRDILLTGGAGDDTLVGFFAQDTLDGGAGNDRLEGGDDADSYVFDLGYGSDVVSDYQTSIFFDDPDKVLFGAGITTADVILSRLGDDLIFDFAGTSDRLTIEDAFYTRFYEVEEYHFHDGTVWSLDDVQDMLIAGTAGDDHLIGFDRADTMNGGLGNDRLEGGDGGDSYLFAAGDGQDVIYDFQATALSDAPDRLIFGAGITAADTHLARVGPSGRNLEVTFTGSSDSLVIEDMLFNRFFEIEEFHFADGTVWDIGQIWNILLGSTAGDDVIIGSDNADSIDGQAGNDTLTGKNGNDSLTGGLGNDSLIGNDGSDTYIFSRGDGVDVIEDDGFGDTDRLVIQGYTPAEVILGRSAPDSGHLVLTFAGTSDQVTVRHGLDNGAGDTIEEVHFDDGTVWTPDDLRAMLLAGSQSAGDDLVHGFKTSDVLEGGLGNDTLHGGEGSDDYVFTRGDGADVIEDDGYLSTDRLVIHGYTPDEVILARAAPGSNHLLLTFVGTADQITVRDTLNGSAIDTIELYVFDDGTVWNSADVLSMADGTDPNAVTHEGTAGNDLLSGTSGDDVFAGRGGDDTIYSTGGSDRFLYASGDGNDFIDEESGSTSYVDSLIFTDLNAGDVTFSRVGLDLMVAVNGTGHVIEVDEQFYSTTAFYGIEEVEFADGTTWNRDQIHENAWIRGTAGVDNLTGFATDDIFYGGAGDDTIFSTKGSDTFIYASGDGNDKIDEENGSTSYIDVLKFTDLNAADISLSKVGVDLMITVTGTGHVIEVDEHFYSSFANFGIEQIDFADGTSWDRAAIGLQATAAQAAAAQSSVANSEADSLSLADLLDDPGLEVSAPLDLPEEPAGTPASDAETAALALFNVMQVSPELPPDDYGATQ